ncbi:unnamed protein product [Pedinophyceae sp. YPF-701]|nr:unnamed protein product [Pedinophyceae sp. YPF-701]
MAAGRDASGGSSTDGDLLDLDGDLIDGDLHDLERDLDDGDLIDGDLHDLERDLDDLELGEEIKVTEDSPGRREARKQWEEKRAAEGYNTDLLRRFSRFAHFFFRKCVKLDASMKLADPLQGCHYGALFGKLADLLLRQFVRRSKDADPCLVDFWTRAPLLLPNGPGGISALQLATPDRLTTASHKVAIEQGDLAFTAHAVNVFFGSNPDLFARDASSFKEMALRAQDEKLKEILKILPNPYAVLLKKRPETRGLLLHYVWNRLSSCDRGDRRQLANAGTNRAKKAKQEENAKEAKQEEDAKEAKQEENAKEAKQEENVEPVAPWAADVRAWVDALVAGNDTWVDDTIANAPMIVGRFGAVGDRRAGGLYALSFDARDCRKLHSERDNLRKCTYGYNALKFTADEAEAELRIPQMLQSLAEHVTSGDELDPRLAKRMDPPGAGAPYLRAAGDRARARDAQGSTTVTTVNLQGSTTVTTVDAQGSTTVTTVDAQGSTTVTTVHGESLRGWMWDEAAVAEAVAEAVAQGILDPHEKEELVQKYRDMVAACEEELEAYDLYTNLGGTKRAERLSQSLGPGWCGCPHDGRCIKRHGNAHLMPNGRRAPGHSQCLPLAGEPESATETALKAAIEAELMCWRCLRKRKYVPKSKAGAAAGGASSGDGDGDGDGGGGGGGCGGGGGDGCGDDGAPGTERASPIRGDDGSGEGPENKVLIDGEKAQLDGAFGLCRNCYYRWRQRGSNPETETPTVQTQLGENDMKTREGPCPLHATCDGTRGNHGWCQISGPPLRTEEVQQQLRATVVCANPECPYHEFAAAWPLAHIGIASCAHGAKYFKPCSDKKYRCNLCEEWFEQHKTPPAKPGEFWDPSPERPCHWQGCPNFGDCSKPTPPRRTHPGKCARRDCHVHADPAELAKRRAAAFVQYCSCDKTKTDCRSNPDPEKCKWARAAAVRQAKERERAQAAKGETSASPLRTEEVQQQLRATVVCANRECPYHEVAAAYAHQRRGHGAKCFKPCSDKKYRCNLCEEWFEEHKTPPAKPGEFWDPSPERPCHWQGCPNFDNCSTLTPPRRTHPGKCTLRDCHVRADPAELAKRRDASFAIYCTDCGETKTDCRSNPDPEKCEWARAAADRKARELEQAPAAKGGKKKKRKAEEAGSGGANGHLRRRRHKNDGQAGQA